jgi:hypothetical protein
MCGVTHKQIVRSQPVPVVKPSVSAICGFEYLEHLFTVSKLKLQLQDVLPTAAPVATCATSEPRCCAEPVAIEVISAAQTVEAPVSRKRKIHFSPLVSIVLIPCLNEYKEANILPSMFWTNEDLKVFRTELLYALQDYLPSVPKGTDKKVALRMMLAEEGALAELHHHK